MSIASRITSIEGHISDIYDSVELTGVDTTGIDKNLVNVPNTLKEGYIDIINNGTDTLYENFPKVSGEGTSLTLNNTYQAPMRNLLKGNTSQTGTPTPTSPIDVDVVSGDNSISICGSNLIGLGTFIYGYTSINDLTFDTNTSAKSYIFETSLLPDTITLTATNGNRSNVSYYDTIPVAGTQGYRYETGNYTTLPRTVTLNREHKYVLIQFAYGNEISNAQINKGNSLLTYEPYNGNTYNIDLPEGMELCKIGTYQDQFKKATGKNLAPINLESETYNTLEITNNNNGTFTLYGNPTGSFGRDIATNLTLKAGTYTISANAMPSGLYIALDNEADTQLSNGTLSKTFTIASDTTYTSLGIWFTKNKDYDVTIKLQIEEGSSVTEWQPMNGWYKVENVGKLIFDGSEDESWTTSGTNPFFYTTITNFVYKGTTPQPALCNLFESKLISSTNDEIGFFIVNTGALRFRVENISTVGNFRIWLASNNVIFYYAHSTPTNEPIPTNLINQLEELYIAKSKENQTNISQVNNDLGFIISASALKKGV